MSTELIINASLPETRISLMENGEIQELLIERASGRGIVGNIYKGRVTRVLPGMQAAFVDIGLEKAAFLYVDDVFVHSEIWEQEERQSDSPKRSSRDSGPITGIGHADTEGEGEIAGESQAHAASGEARPPEGGGEHEGHGYGGESSPAEPGEIPEEPREFDLDEEDDGDFDDLDEDDPGSDHLDPDDVTGGEDDEDDDEGPVGMDGGPERPDGTQGPSDGGGG